MTAPKKPGDETARLHALKEVDILDTDHEEEFDQLALIAAAICGVPISTVTFIDSERQWHKAFVGHPGHEGPRDTSLCAHTILEPKMLYVPDLREDERFSDNPFVKGQPNVRFYAGVPIKSPDGHNIGSLCVIDTEPRELNIRQRLALEALASQASKELEQRLLRKGKIAA